MAYKVAMYNGRLNSNIFPILRARVSIPNKSVFPGVPGAQGQGSPG